jgi:hypothetical protein
MCSMHPCAQQPCKLAMPLCNVPAIPTGPSSPCAWAPLRPYRRVLQVWAVRENLSEMMFGVQALALPRATFYMMTLVIVAAALGLSIVVPSVWELVSLVGSTACVVFSYIFPGLLVLKNESGVVERGVAGGVVVLGVMMAVIAVYDTLTGQSVGR